jgi:rubrerythrin
MIYPFNAVEAVKIAISIETNGLKFYLDAAKRFAPSPAADLFARLAGEEVHHKEYFEKLLEGLPKDGPTAFDPDNEMDQYLEMMAGMHVFQQDPAEVKKTLDAIKTQKDALELAINFEKDSVLFYVQLKEAAAGVADAISVEKLIAEEARHLRILAREYNKLFRGGK